MRSIYIDSNVAFALASDDQSLSALVAAQSRGQLRVVLGWRLAWEMAGAFSKKAELIHLARQQARRHLALVDAGAYFAQDGWGAAGQVVRLPASRRAEYSALIRPGHADYTHAKQHFRDLAGTDKDEAIRHWYDPHVSELRPYRVGEEHFRRKLREDIGTARFSRDRSLREMLDWLEQVGWTQAVVQVIGRQLGFARIGSRPRPIDWYGPLGRIIRASCGYSIIQAAGCLELERQGEEDSDLADLSHIVAAGFSARTFVTRDRTAKVVYDATWPSRGRSCMHYEREFLPYLASLNAQ